MQLMCESNLWAICLLRRAWRSSEICKTQSPWGRAKTNANHMHSSTSIKPDQKKLTKGPTEVYKRLQSRIKYSYEQQFKYSKQNPVVIYIIAQEFDWTLRVVKIINLWLTRQCAWENLLDPSYEAAERPWAENTERGEERLNLECRYTMWLTRGLDILFELQFDSAARNIIWPVFCRSEYIRYVYDMV